MPIIRLTKQDVQKAKKAREAALKKDPEFRAYTEEMEKMMDEETKQQKKEVK